LSRESHNSYEHKPIIDTLPVIELSLKSLTSSYFVREFCPTFDYFIMFKECSSGVRTPNFGEWKQTVFDFAQGEVM